VEGRRTRHEEGGLRWLRGLFGGGVPFRRGIRLVRVGTARPLGFLGLCGPGCFLRLVLGLGRIDAVGSAAAEAVGHAAVAGAAGVDAAGAAAGGIAAAVAVAADAAYEALEQVPDEEPALVQDTEPVQVQNKAQAPEPHREQAQEQRTEQAQDDSQEQEQRTAQAPVQADALQAEEHHSYSPHTQPEQVPVPNKEQAPEEAVARYQNEMPSSNPTIYERLYAYNLSYINLIFGKKRCGRREKSFFDVNPSICAPLDRFSFWSLLDDNGRLLLFLRMLFSF